MVTTEDRELKLFHCPALTAIQVIAGKWKTRILWLLRDRPYHFGELRRTLPGVSAKVLTDHLHGLEADGIVERHEEQRAGVTHVVYGFSSYGRSLIPALDALGNWGLAHQDRT